MARRAETRAQGGALGFGPRPRLVRKRDGRLVPYDPKKVREAVARAQEAVGEPDPSFAADVAEVVELALARRAGLARPNGEGGDAEAAGDVPGEREVVPGIEEIQDLVEQALIELGRARTAKAYILYRDRRSRAREALAVHGPAREGGPRVREAERTSPWSKGRIAADLVSEADLSRNQAEAVAARVEERIFASGLETVSTGLVRALVDNELVQLGLGETQRRSAPVALARYDLRRALAGAGARAFEPWLGLSDADGTGGEWAAGDGSEGAGLERALSSETLKRYALDEALDPQSAQLHLDGELHVEDLGRAHLYLTLGVPAELALGGLAPEGGAFALLEGLVPLLRATSRGLVLEDSGAVLGELARATRARSPLGLAGWLQAAAALAGAAGRRIDLISPGSRQAALRARLLEELARPDAGPEAPRLFLDEEEASELAEASAGARAELGRLVAQGRVVLSWSRGEGRFAGPGLVRRPGERGLLALAGAVALNLPRLAHRAGPWREERLFEELSGLVALAHGACRSLAGFQERAAGARPGPLRPRTAFALVPIGLREALRHLGGGDVDPEQGARLVGLLDEAARRLARPGAPPMTLSPFFGERARRRLAWLDAGRPGDSPGQGVLFAGAESPAPRAAAYGTGLVLSPLPGWRAGEPEAELARTLAQGALYPPVPEPARAEPDGPASPLVRFLSARARQRRGRSPLLPLEASSPAVEVASGAPGQPDFAGENAAGDIEQRAAALPASSGGAGTRVPGGGPTA